MTSRIVLGLFPTIYSSQGTHDMHINKSQVDANHRRMGVGRKIRVRKLRVCGRILFGTQLISGLGRKELWWRLMGVSVLGVDANALMDRRVDLTCENYSVYLFSHYHLSFPTFSFIIVLLGFFFVPRSLRYFRRTYIHPTHDRVMFRSLSTMIIRSSSSIICIKLFVFCHSI